MDKPGKCERYGKIPWLDMKVAPATILMTNRTGRRLYDLRDDLGALGKIGNRTHGGNHKLEPIDILVA